MTRYLAIDPGNIDSAYVIVDQDSRPLEFNKLDNGTLRHRLREVDADVAVIEMVASYGMAVGAEVFETCVWIGRFVERLSGARYGEMDIHLVKRLSVKLHHCHDSKAKDSNIRQALVDRFALGEPNHGKGTKANPGWFYGFSADVWQAYALAVYAADTRLDELAVA